MNDPSASEQDGFGAIPRAKRVPKERVFHGDTFIDQYEWLRDKQSQDVRDYVAAQNRYCEQRMAPLKSLRKTLFEEFKSHVQETDMSVPTRMAWASRVSRSIGISSHCNTARKACRTSR